MAKDKIGEDLAVIKTQIENLLNTFEDFKVANEKYCDKMSVKVGELEVSQAKVDQRVSLLATFQSIFSIAIGGIATYLGSRK